MIIRVYVALSSVRSLNAGPQFNADAAFRTARHELLTRHVVGHERPGAPISVEAKPFNGVATLHPHQVKHAIAPRWTSDLFLRPALGTSNECVRMGRNMTVLRYAHRTTIKR